MREYNQKELNDFMQEAINEGYLGIENQEGGPFGCVIVKDGKIVGRGHNQVIKNQDCTCHGEIQAIRDACKNLGTFDLTGCDLFTSSSPCPLCRGACQWARLRRIYEACNIKDAEDIGFDDKIFFENPIETETVNREAGLKLFEHYKNIEHTLY